MKTFNNRHYFSPQSFKAVGRISYMFKSNFLEKQQMLNLKNTDLSPIISSFSLTKPHSHLYLQGWSNSADIVSNVTNQRREVQGGTRRQT